MQFSTRLGSTRFNFIRPAALIAWCWVSVAFSSYSLGQQPLYSGAGFRGASPVAPVRRVAPVVTQNFVVYAADATMAQKVAREAERYRKELAVEWLGRELETWNQKCPITVEIGRHAGGETSFAFNTNGNERGTPVDWQMKIFGPPDRLLDAVLPHEITHTIFASHFGRPLPRWADEGACTTVEHVSERSKNHRMLIEFLTAKPSRGISFNRMFTMKDYPEDILPLYAQGYSLARFLILQKGRRHFLDFVGKGLESEFQVPALRAWDQATNEFYGYQNLSDLYLNWIDWVKKGSSETAFQRVAAAPVPNASAASLGSLTSPVSASHAGNSMSATFASANSGSWYARQMSQGASVASQRNEPNSIMTRSQKISTEGESEGGGARSPAIPDNSSPPVIRRAASGTIWR